MLAAGSQCASLIKKEREKKKPGKSPFIVSDHDSYLKVCPTTNKQATVFLEFQQV